MNVSELTPSRDVPGPADGRRLAWRMRALLRDIGESARPPVYRYRPWLATGTFFAAVFLWHVQYVTGLAGENLYNLWLWRSLVAVGFYFVFGVAGLFAFSTAAFVGLGGFASAYATRPDGLPLLPDQWWVGLLFAGCITGAVALVFSVLMWRAHHFYFAVGTLALSELTLVVLRRWRGFTGGTGDGVSGISPPSLLGYEFRRDTVFFLLFAVLALMFLVGHLLERSPLVREAIAGRDRETVASTLGVPTLKLRITMFVFGSVVAGFAGSVFVHWKTFASAESYGVGLGLDIFLIVILGGIHSMWGAVIGAWFFTFVPEWLRFSDEWRQVFYGSLLIVAIVALPDGLVGVFDRLAGALRRTGATVRPNRLHQVLHSVAPPWNPSSRPAVPPGEPDAVPAVTWSTAGAARDTSLGRAVVGDDVLVAEAVSVTFGGVRACDEISLRLHRGEILGLIGPNGSGKTTFANALTGVVPATGRVLLDGRELVMGRPRRVRLAGVVRAYQTPQNLLALSCIENVCLTTTDRRFTGLTPALATRPPMLRHERRRWERAIEALRRLGLEELAEVPASALSYGQQRLLELARAIAGEPRVLVLDEPSAGLNASETAFLADVLLGVRDDGVGILLIDHKIDFIDEVCDHVVVLELGRVIAQGRPEVVWRDPGVMDAYLGTVGDDR